MLNRTRKSIVLLQGLPVGTVEQVAVQPSAVSQSQVVACLRFDPPTRSAEPMPPAPVNINVPDPSDSQPSSASYSIELPHLDTPIKLDNNLVVPLSTDSSINFEIDSIQRLSLW